MDMSYDNEFPCGFGRLIANIVQLEFAIRVALHLQEPEQHRMHTETLRDLKPGDVLPENFLTNWGSLGNLIREYNARETARGGAAIDSGIVDLRDALAHGRISSSTAASQYRLIRFSKPRGGDRKVTVEQIDTLTLEWLDQQIRRTVAATVPVHNRIMELNPSARRAR